MNPNIHIITSLFLCLLSPAYCAEEVKHQQLSAGTDDTWHKTHSEASFELRCDPLGTRVFVRIHGSDQERSGRITAVVLNDRPIRSEALERINAALPRPAILTRASLSCQRSVLYLNIASMGRHNREVGEYIDRFRLVDADFQ